MSCSSEHVNGRGNVIFAPRIIAYLFGRLQRHGWISMLVICPICNDPLEGEGENDLSLNLQEHFAVRHGYTGLCDLKGGQAASCERSESGRLADLPYGERRIREAHRLEEPVHPGEDVMESVRCPMCGKAVFGHASDDLSYGLASHLSREHRVKVSVLGKG
jgi:hypothetical protein